MQGRRDRKYSPTLNQHWVYLSHVKGKTPFAIWHARKDTTTDAKIAWLSTPQRDDQRGVQRDMSGEKNVTVLKMIALPIALVHVCFGNDKNSVF